MGSLAIVWPGDNTRCSARWAVYLGCWCPGSFRQWIGGNASLSPIRSNQMHVLFLLVSHQHARSWRCQYSWQQAKVKMDPYFYVRKIAIGEGNANIRNPPGRSQRPTPPTLVSSSTYCSSRMQVGLVSCMQGYGVEKVHFCCCVPSNSGCVSACVHMNQYCCSVKRPPSFLANRGEKTRCCYQSVSADGICISQQLGIQAFISLLASTHETEQQTSE